MTGGDRAVGPAPDSSSPDNSAKHPAGPSWLFGIYGGGASLS